MVAKSVTHCAGNERGERLAMKAERMDSGVCAGALGRIGSLVEPVGNIGWHALSLRRAWYWPGLRHALPQALGRATR
jgi:hypothetical protein